MKGGNSMDQKKIGSFLKELRKEKEITQNQLAAIDKLNKQLDDFNVAQATQIFRIKQALMGIALDK